MTRSERPRDEPGRGTPGRGTPGRGTPGRGTPAVGPRGSVAPPSGERLFRRRALERYAHRDEESVLPRLARPPAFAALWALVALLVILAGVVGALPLADERIVPLVVTAEGPRLILPGETSPVDGAVSSGDPVRFVLAGVSVNGRVGVVGEARSPAELRAELDVARLGLEGLGLDGPRRLATIDMTMDPLVDSGIGVEISVDQALGAVAEARVTVDRPRLMTLLPGVGPWLARRLDDRSREASP